MRNFQSDCSGGGDVMQFEYSDYNVNDLWQGVTPHLEVPMWVRDVLPGDYSICGQHLGVEQGLIVESGGTKKGMDSTAWPRWRTGEYLVWKILVCW